MASSRLRQARCRFLQAISCASRNRSKFRYIGKGGIDIVDRKAIANFKRLALDLKDSSRAKSPGGSKTEHRGGRQDLGANCLRPGILFIVLLNAAGMSRRCSALRAISDSWWASSRHWAAIETNCARHIGSVIDVENAKHSLARSRYCSARFMPPLKGPGARIRS